MIKVKDKEHNIIKIDSVKTKKYEIEIAEIKEGEKISILSDSMFKCMFVNSSRIKYGAKLISYFVDVTYEELLNNIKLINSELNKNVVSSKGERCDYIAEINDAIVNIEVNCNSSIETLKRNIDYAHRLFAKSVEVGKEYNFTQVVQINLNNFAFKNNDKVIDIYYIQNDEKDLLTNNLIFIQISVPNLRKKCYTKGIDKLEEVERFILSLAETNIDSAKDIGMEDDFMQESINDQIEFGLDEDLREAYDHELAWKEEWERRGHEEGLEQGREEGHAEGIIEAAKKFIESGISKEEVAKILGIDIKQIDNK